MTALSSYSFKASFFEKEKTYTLLPHAITVEEFGGFGREEFLLSEIKEVRLSYNEGRNSPEVYFCSITLHSGRKIILKSAHIKGFASFEHLKLEYTEFVEALHELLVQYPHISFKRGFKPWFYTVMLGFGVFGLGANIYIMSLVFDLLGWISLLFVAVAIFSLYTMSKSLIKNKPGEYVPQQLPKELLP